MAQPKQGDGGRGGGPAILIVDPDRYRQEGLAAILRQQWPRVRCGFAGAYSAAVDLLGQGRWDLALVELNIPGRGGLDVVSELVRTWRLPCLLVAGEPEEVYGLRALRAGSAGYLRRDLPAAEIAAAVARVLGGGHHVSEGLAEVLAARLDPVADERAAPFGHLSDREFQVLRAVADGQSVKEIAAALSLSAKTVSTYRARILAKLGAKTDADLIRHCIHKGLAGREGPWRATDRAADR